MLNHGIGNGAADAGVVLPPIVQRLCGKESIGRFQSSSHHRPSIRLDRPFNPASFPCLGKGYKIIGEEEDKRSLALSSVDLEMVCPQTMVGHGECISGETKLQRLIAAGHIRLDAAVCAAFREHWQKARQYLRGVTALYFFGTPLLDPKGKRCVLYICQGHCGTYHLDKPWHSGHPAAMYCPEGQPGVAS